MRSWSVAGKYPIFDGDGSISHTEIVITSTTAGYATFTERVLGDQTNKTERELVELAREALFKSEFADRAMAESVQKIDEIEAVVKSAKKFMQDAEEKMSSIARSQQELEQATAEAKQATIRNEQAVNNAVSELTELVMGIVASFASVESVEEAENEEFAE